MNRREKIIDVVTGGTGICYDDITSKSRKQEVCEARQLAAYALRTFGGMTLREAADAVGYASHASVIRDLAMVGWRIEHDRQFRERNEDLLRKIELTDDVEEKTGTASKILVIILERNTNEMETVTVTKLVDMEMEATEFKVITKKDFSIQLREDELLALRKLIDTRLSWLQKKENKQRGTYDAVARDTRELINIRERKMAVLSELKQNQ